MSLRLAARTTGASSTVTVDGSIDLDTAPQLRDLLIELIDAGARDLALDVETVDYIDSTGLGVLAGGFKKVRSRGGDLALVCSPGHRLRKVLRITGLDQAFTVQDHAQRELATT